MKAQLRHAFVFVVGALLGGGALEAAGPTPSEIATIEEKAFRARQNAIEACEESPSSSLCMQFGKEFATLQGQAHAMRDIAIASVRDPSSLDRQKTLLQQHSSAAEQTCRSATFFAECQAHLAEMERANAYLVTHDRYMGEAEAAQEVREAQLAVAAGTQGARAVGGQKLCDERVYGSICKNAQQHLETTTASCANGSASAQCRRVASDLDAVAAQIKTENAAAGGAAAQGDAVTP